MKEDRERETMEGLSVEERRREKGEKERENMTKTLKRRKRK